MALIDILAELATDFGVDLANAEERSFLVDMVNRTAQEAYETQDLRGCEREFVLQIDENSKQISMTDVVDKILAVREYDYGNKIELNDMHPRYMTGSWRFEAGLNFNWRIKGVSALKRDISEETHINISVPQANSTSFNVLIKGGNTNTRVLSEVLTFFTSDTSKQSLAIYDRVDYIKIVGTLDYDVDIQNDDGESIGGIPNNATKSSFLIVQVLDATRSMSQDLVVEVLFKHKYVPVVADNDEFIFGDKYDRALYYMTAGKILEKHDGKEQRALLAFEKASALFAEIAANIESHIEKKIQKTSQNNFNRIMAGLNFNT